MTPALAVKLRPTGPWRIGSDSGARNQVDLCFHSDALFSAVTSALARLGAIDEWLDATARAQGAPAVAFSSCFPFQDGVQYVPPPRSVWPPAAPGLSGRVRWKSARFAPLSLVRSILAGKRLDENRWRLDGPSGCLTPSGKIGPFRTSIRSSAAVDRLTGVVDRHSIACVEFRPGAGLWTVVSFAGEAARDRWLEPVKGAFRLLADSGFGGERSRGWGRADSPEFTEGTLPEMLLPPAEPEPETAPAVAEPEPVPEPEAQPASPEVAAIVEEALAALAEESAQMSESEPQPEPELIAAEAAVRAPSELEPLESGAGLPACLPEANPGSDGEPLGEHVAGDSSGEDVAERAAAQDAYDSSELAPEPAPPIPEAPAPDPEVQSAAPEPTFEPAPAAPGFEAATPRWLLSLFTPAAVDAVDWERGNYALTTRAGRVESSAKHGELKKHVQMVAEGSVLMAIGDLHGAASDVAPDGFAHPVHRAGFAVTIPLPEQRPAARTEAK